MQINRYINGKKAQKLPEKVGNEEVKAAVAEAERRMHTAKENA